MLALLGPAGQADTSGALGSPPSYNQIRHSRTLDLFYHSPVFPKSGPYVDATTPSNNTENISVQTNLAVIKHREGGCQ